MATATFNSMPYNSNDAQFRAWGSALCAAITAVGGVQTGDTGQINWATVSAPTATNQSMGYAIFKFADFYLKIEFGSSNIDYSYPAVWVTCGTETNGTGALVGSVSLRSNIVFTGTISTCTSYVSGDTDRITVALWGNSDRPVVFSAERTAGQSGTYDGAGLLFFSTPQPNGSPISQWLSYVATSAPIARWNASVPYGQTSMAYSGDVYLVPVRAWARGESPASRCLWLYFGPDLTNYNPISSTIWDGSTAVIMPLGSNGASLLSLGTGGITAFAMRFD